MRTHLLFFFIFAFVFSGNTQFYDDPDYPFYTERPFYIGAGLGTDFGGLGGKVEYMPLDFLGVFTGAGTNFTGVGINGGVILKPLYKRQLTPYFIGMYGYTATIEIEGASYYDRTDYGFSIGGGLEIKTKNFNIWQLGVILPFRSQDFIDHYEYLKSNPYVELDADLPPVQISLGFKLCLF